MNINETLNEIFKLGVTEIALTLAHPNTNLPPGAPQPVSEDPRPALRAIQQIPGINGSPMTGIQHQLVGPSYALILEKLLKQADDSVNLFHPKIENPG